MKTKNYLFIVGIFLVTIITLSIIIALRPDENTGDEEISEELRAVRQTFVCELSEDKTHYIILGLKNPEQRYDEIVFPSKIDDLPVSKIIDKKNQNFIDFKNVKKVFIPDSITYIGTDEKDNSIANRPFLQSTNLNEIVVDENNPVYADFLAKADGGANLAALSTKTCLEQEDWYFTSPAFDGSSDARNEVGYLLDAAFTGTKTIDQAFEDAYSNCVY